LVWSETNNFLSSNERWKPQTFITSFPHFSLVKFEAVLFDLDGTLVELNLNFDAIREALGIKERFILEAIQNMNEPDRSYAIEKLKNMEISSAFSAKLNPGVKELLEYLKNRKIKTGIVTRNCRESVEIILKRFKIHVDCIISREDAPPKPSPEPIKLALNYLKISPNNALYIGDFFFDIEAGHKAGTKTVLLLHERNRAYSSQADYVVNSLLELIDILEKENLSG